METIDTPPHLQQRSAFRTMLSPSEIGVNRLWIHPEDVAFNDDPLGPSRYILMLVDGVSLMNISAAGVLSRLVVPPELGLLRKISHYVGRETGGRRSAFHDVSMIMRIDLRKDLRDVFVSGKVMRATLVRTTAKASIYEVALHFYSWANLSGANVQCYRVRDDSVPPLAAWITRKQLSRK